MTSLIVSFVPLIAAPLLCWMCARTAALAQFMDGFLFVAIGGLIVSGVLPQVWLHGGWPVVPFLLLGLLLPVLSERIVHQEGEVHRVALLLGLSGLLLHAITDGAALLAGEGEHLGGDLLSTSVLLHRLPIGLTIWWLVHPQFGLWAASSVLGVIGLGTVLGFAFAPDILEPLSTQGMALFQAFVAGSLVHVLYHRPHASSHGHDHDHDHHHPAQDDTDRWGDLRRCWPDGVGSVLGGALVIYLASQHQHHGEWAWLETMEHTLLDLALVSAPVLLLAYGVSAAVELGFERLPAAARGRGRWWWLGNLVQDCCQPAQGLDAQRLRRLSSHGVAPAAALALMVVSALVGLDVLLLSLPLLGSEFMLLRVLSAGGLALLLAWLVPRRVPPASLVPERAGEASRPAAFRAGWLAWPEALVVRIEQSGPWLMLGLFSAAIAQPMLDDGLLQHLPERYDVLIYAVLGLPVYLCAAGTTPLVAVLLIGGGVSPGAALAFLITGPLVHLGLFTMLSRAYGSPLAGAWVILVILAFALGFGYVLDVLPFELSLPDWRQAADAGAPWQRYPLLVLAGLNLFVILRGGARAFVVRLFNHPGSAAHGHHQH